MCWCSFILCQVLRLNASILYNQFPLASLVHSVVEPPPDSSGLIAFLSSQMPFLEHTHTLTPGQFHVLMQHLSRVYPGSLARSLSLCAVSQRSCRRMIGPTDHCRPLCLSRHIRLNSPREYWWQLCVFAQCCVFASGRQKALVSLVGATWPAMKFLIRIVRKVENSFTRCARFLSSFFCSFNWNSFAQRASNSNNKPMLMMLFSPWRTTSPAILMVNWRWTDGELVVNWWDKMKINFILCCPVVFSCPASLSQLVVQRYWQRRIATNINRGRNWHYFRSVGEHDSWNCHRLTRFII